MAYVTAEPDDSRSIGHARIVIDGLGQIPADTGFRIIREGYPTPNLGRRGWQVGEERLKPVSASIEGGSVVLVVGPAITMHLLVEPYQFSIPSVGVEAALFWPDTIDVFDGPIPEAPEIPPDDPPAPPPRPAPDLEVTRIQRPAEPPPPTPSPAPPTPRPPVKPDPGGSKTPLILGGLLLVLLAAGGGGTWWYMNQPPPAPPAPAPVQAPAHVPMPIPTPTPVPAPPTWPDGTDALNLQDVVTRAPNPAGIYAVALRRQAEGKHDDALVLFEEAAERGHAPAMTAVAKMYDPNGFVPGRPFQNADPRAAAKYYRDAVRAGDPAADAPRAALRAMLEGLVASGNALAEAYLREFWP